MNPAKSTRPWRPNSQSGGRWAGMSDADSTSGGNRSPKFFNVAADPCEQNPFTAHDPRHGVWGRATRRAEEELSKLTELIPEAYMRHLENEWTRTKAELSDGGPVGTISMSPVLVPFYRGTFDTWAWRNLAAIAGDDDLPIYDRWLIKYAQSWLELIESRDDPEALKRPLIRDLHTSLQAGIAHWKSEARKHLRLQEGQSGATEIGVPAKGPEAGPLRTEQDLTSLGAGPPLPSNLKPKPLLREEFFRLTAGRVTVTNAESMHILGVSARHLRRLVKGDQAADLHPKLLTGGPRKEITVESLRVYLGYRP